MYLLTRNPSQSGKRRFFGGQTSSGLAACVVPANILVRHLHCTNADLAEISRVVGRQVTAADVRTAITGAVEQAVGLLLNAAQPLTLPRAQFGIPQQVLLRQHFLDAFGVGPEFVPAWRPAGQTWDRGVVVRERLRCTARILSNGSIRYRCWGPLSCRDFTRPWIPEHFARVRVGQLRICFGEAFWAAFRDGQTNELAATILHEALHIYFGTIGDTRDRGSFGFAACYERFVQLVNQQPLSQFVIDNCTTGLPRGDFPLPPKDRAFAAVGISETSPAPQSSPPSTSALNLFLQRFREVVRRGGESVALAWALSQGIRNENELASIIFHTRYPERGGKKLVREEPQFRQLSKEWLDIRERMVRPALRRFKTGGLPSSERKPTVKEVSLVTIKNISAFDRLIDSLADQHKVDPNIVRGIIAAESDGDPNSGAENAQGYKGLMQAGTGREQLDPETSIRSGIEHFLNKRRIVARILRSLGIDIDSVDQDTALKYVMTAYNAGEGTLQKALQYAKASGDVINWEKPEHFQRALFFTGAYSVRAPLKWCLKKLPATIAAKALSDLTGMDAERLIRDYFVSPGGWDVNLISKAFGTVILSKLAAENKKLRKKDFLTIEKARELASPLLICSVEFKAMHRLPYIDKVLRYKRHFDANRRFI